MMRVDDGKWNEDTVKTEKKGWLTFGTEEVESSFCRSLSGDCFIPCRQALAKWRLLTLALPLRRKVEDTW